MQKSYKNIVVFKTSALLFIITVQTFILSANHFILPWGEMEEF